MTPLPYLSVLKVSGADAGKFLQSQLAAQLAGMKIATAAFSAYCSSRGQVIATLLVSPRNDHWLVVVESSLLQTLVDRLQKYVLRDDVQFELLAGQNVFAAEPDDFLADGVILLEPRAVPVRYAISDMKPAAEPEAMASWRRSEFLFGIPWLDAASSEKYIPQMLGLDAIEAVSFSKGCYPGQEVIARTRHLGEVKRRPLVLDIEGPKAPDLQSPCLIHTSGGQVAATLVDGVASAATQFTVFAVAALTASESIHAMEQDGVEWSARRASREQHQ